MRACHLFSVLLLANCAGSRIASEKPAGPFDIAVKHEGPRERPTLVVTIKNKSDETWCVEAEALQNPWSHSMDLQMRERNGRLAKVRGGYALPPIEGTVRIEPGGVVQGQYHFDARFKRINAGQQVPSGLRVKASFRYGPCGAPTSLRATSAWLPI
jgi:hypothetical protein